MKKALTKIDKKAGSILAIAFHCFAIIAVLKGNMYVTGACLFCGGIVYTAGEFNHHKAHTPKKAMKMCKRQRGFY